jgi:hypothetical protein
MFMELVLHLARTLLIESLQSAGKSDYIEKRLI